MLVTEAVTGRVETFAAVFELLAAAAVATALGVLPATDVAVGRADGFSCSFRLGVKTRSLRFPNSSPF